MRLLIVFLTCITLSNFAHALKQKYSENSTVNNHLIWPTMGSMAKEKLRFAVDQGATSMVISTDEMQTIIDITGKYYVRMTMNGVSRAKILHANVKNWMDIIGKLKNYTHTFRKRGAYFAEKKQAFALYTQQLKDLSKYLKKSKYNAEFVSDFLYKLYDMNRLTFEQIGEFIQNLKKNHNQKSNETDLDQILDQFIDNAQSAKETEDEIDDDMSIPGLY